jgi:isoquinoline 1-oxidoreductase
MTERTLAEIVEDHGISPEMLSGPMMSRRSFVGALGGGIVVLLTVPGLALEAEAQPRSGRRGRGAGREVPDRIAGWLHIDEHGAVTAYAGKVELGQNVRTSMAMVVAEELRLAPAQVTVVLADTALCPFDAGTFGSRSTPVTVPPMRQAAAAARELLLDLAATQLSADRATLKIAEGKVTDPATGRSLGFGGLTKGQELAQVIPANVQATPPAQWKVVGQPAHKVDARDIVTGRKKYASDFRQPGMLHGKVLRPAALHTELTAVDTSGAEVLPGVVVCRQPGFVGVAAPTQEGAEKALRAIKAQWDHTPQISQAELFEHLRKTAGQPSGGSASRGAVETAMAGAAVTLKQTYTVAYVAHSAIEPRSAVAEWNGDNLEVWCATQSPFGVRGELAQTFGIPESRVHVIGLDTGVGYGGKTRCLAAVEAARLAKVAGKPVQVAWTRQEEQAWNHYRPAGIIDIASGAASDGALVAWEYDNYNAGPSAMGTPYDVPHQAIELHQCEYPLPQGAYRALAAPVNTWARETHMDELAYAVKMDPVTFRLRNATDPRLRAVLKTAAARFGWRDKPGPGRGLGIAAGTEKGSYIATCAQVRVDADGKVKVERLLSAFEPGAIINPLHMRAQVEGGAAMALGAALFEAVKFEDGRILNAAFTQYRVPRFSDMPEIESVLIDRRDLPSAGGGETPTCAVGAAVGNAIFSATGVRLRSLPLAPNGRVK